MEKLLERVKEEEGQAEGGAIVLDATAEFCRTLGDIPTYGQAGNRDHHAEIMVCRAPFPLLTSPIITFIFHNILFAAPVIELFVVCAQEMEQEEGEGTAPGPGPGAEAGGAWSRVDVHSEQAPDLAAGERAAAPHVTQIYHWFPTSHLHIYEYIEVL